MGETEHYRKKLEELRRRTEELRRGSEQLRRSVDAILIAAALTYGKEYREEDKVVGHSLTLPKIQVDTLLEEYELHARPDGETYVVGVMPR